MEPLVYKFQSVAHNSKRMAQISKVLDIPLISTAQSPKTFGYTVPLVTGAHHPGVKTFIKDEFTMMEKPVMDYF